MSDLDVVVHLNALAPGASGPSVAACGRTSPMAMSRNPAEVTCYSCRARGPHKRTLVVTIGDRCAACDRRDCPLLANPEHTEQGHRDECPGCQAGDNCRAEVDALRKEAIAFRRAGVRLVGDLIEVTVR